MRPLKAGDWVTYTGTTWPHRQGRRLLVVEDENPTLPWQVAVWEHVDKYRLIVLTQSLHIEPTLDDAYQAVLQGYFAAQEAHNERMLTILRSCSLALDTAARTYGGWRAVFKDEYVFNPDLRDEINRLLQVQGFDR